MRWMSSAGALALALVLSQPAAAQAAGAPLKRVYAAAIAAWHRTA